MLCFLCYLLLALSVSIMGGADNPLVTDEQALAACVTAS